MEGVHVSKRMADGPGAKSRNYVVCAARKQIA